MDINPDVLAAIIEAYDIVKNRTSAEINTPLEQTPPPSQVPEQIIKVEQFEEEKMQAIEVMYCPPEENDLHGERMSDIEIRKMVDNFNANINNVKGNLGHIKNTDKFKPIKAWVNEVDCLIGDNLVVEGTPLVKIQFYDKDLFEKRKSGQIMGLSIGAMGRTVIKD